MEGIRRINESAQVADILTNFNLLIGYISIAVILLLLCVSVFLISNTVTIGIAVRKEEIAIMKLIGATNGFVKAPFVVEGIIIGLIGASIPLALLYFLYTKLINFMGGQVQYSDRTASVPAGRRDVPHSASGRPGPGRGNRIFRKLFHDPEAPESIGRPLDSQARRKRADKLRKVNI